MNSSELGSIISSPTARKAVYAAFVVAGLVLGGVQAWYGAAEPEWLIRALAVYGELAIGATGLAVANTPSKTPAA